MDLRLELIPVPVADVERAKAFYAGPAGFALDNDVTVKDGLRFIQLTPPGLGVLDLDRGGHHRDGAGLA